MTTTMATTRQTGILTIIFILVWIDRELVSKMSIMHRYFAPLLVLPTGLKPFISAPKLIGSRCLDYIWFSTDSLKPVAVLDTVGVPPGIETHLINGS